MNFRFFTLLLLAVIVIGACDNQTTIVPASVRLEADIAAIDEYLTSNGIDAVKDTTGVRYVIHSSGTGVQATINDCVKARYKGTLLSDGSTFDEGDSLKIRLLQTIAGWQIVFPHLTKGSTATMYVPSYYGYGTSQGYEKIPANSILVFEVELLEVYAYNSAGYCYDDPILPEEEQNAIDAQIIDTYLSDNAITAETDTSGLRYVVNSLGSGTMPTTSSCVRVNYSGNLLSGTVFDQGTNYKAPLVKLIEGWQVGLPLFPKGSKVTLYIPSRMGYGVQSVGSKVPANSNLIFEIEIVDVTDYNATTNSCN